MTPLRAVRRATSRAKAGRQSCAGSRGRLTHSASETEKIGALFSRRLRAGDCVCLSGPLGAGKTCFVRGAMRGLGVGNSVSSPTFTLAHESFGKVPVAHLDFYRLEVRAEERGLMEYLDGRHVVFIEWAERDRAFWPRRFYRVRIDKMTGSRRRIRIECPE